MKYPMFRLQLQLPIDAAAQLLQIVAEEVDPEDWPYTALSAVTAEVEHEGLQDTRCEFFITLRVFFGTMLSICKRMDEDLPEAYLDGSNLRITTEDWEIDDLVQPPLHYSYTHNYYDGPRKTEDGKPIDEKKKH